MDLCAQMEGVQCNDNAAVLAALERRGGGVFSLVNDEIRTPAGTPGHLLTRMRQAAAASPSPLRATPEQAEGTFQLDHYAGSVVYEVPVPSLARDAPCCTYNRTHKANRPWSWTESLVVGSADRGAQCGAS